MLIVFLVIIGLVVIWWVKSESDAKQEEIITRPAREAAAETRRLRQHVDAEQRAARVAQAEANVAVAKAIEHLCSTSYATLLKPFNYKWNPNGIRLDGTITLRTKTELNVFIGAWRAYIFRSNPARVPL